MLTLGVAALACLGLTDALPPPHHHFYKSDKASGGNGYKLFDSFHKKDGDSYELEKHSEFGDGDRGKDSGISYHRTSSYNSGNHKPKAVSYHYETKHGTPRDYSKYNPETYEGDYSHSRLAPSSYQYHTSSIPSAVGFSKPLSGKKHKSQVKKGKTATAGGGRNYGTFDSHSAEEEDPEFGFYDDGDEEGSFEGEIFSGETPSSFETDNSGEYDVY